MRQNPDEIDVTIEHLITKERRAKGDLEVAINSKKYISRAIPARITIIKELVRVRVLPYHYEIYGVGFLEFQNAFRAPWAIRKMMGLLEQLGGGLSSSQVDAIYENVYRKLGKDRVAIIEFVLNTQERRTIKKDSVTILKDRRKDNVPTLKNCFEKLVEAVDEERRRVYEESNNY